MPISFSSPQRMAMINIGHLKVINGEDWLMYNAEKIKNLGQYTKHGYVCSDGLRNNWRNRCSNLRSV
jgi:hypothetical protein